MGAEIKPSRCRPNLEQTNGRRWGGKKSKVDGWGKEGKGKQARGRKCTCERRDVETRQWEDGSKEDGLYTPFDEEEKERVKLEKLQ